MGLLHMPFIIVDPTSTNTISGYNSVEIHDTSSHKIRTYYQVGDYQVCEIESHMNLTRANTIPPKKVVQKNKPYYRKGRW